MLDLRRLDGRLQELWVEEPFIFLLHAPEDEGRTEDPTDNRKRKARDEEGRLFFTQDLPQAMLILMGVSLLFILASYYKSLFFGMFQDYFVNFVSIDVTYDNMERLIIGVVVLILKLFLPVGVLGVFVVILFYGIQTNFFISAVNLKMDFKRIAFSWDNFLKKTIFSRMQLINFGKVLVKITIVAVMSYFYLKYQFLHSKGLMMGSIQQGVGEVFYKVYLLIMMIASFFLLTAFPDWFLQKMEYERNLKMSKEEVKREYKELEGDPLIKAKIRQRARELATKDMINAVKEADVLITNPTHFACAIKYAFKEMDAPKLLGKGQDFVALKMREVAEEYRVPIVENKPLARALYANVEVNEYVPVEYYSAIAEILAALDKYKVGA